jgi:cation-transporting ATPase F
MRAEQPMLSLIEEHCHSVAGSGVAHLLGTDLRRGLELDQIDSRRQRFGPNRLSERKAKGPLALLFDQLRQPLVLILLIAAAVTAALGQLVDSGVILGVVAVNAVIGFVQESRALGAIAALSRTLNLRATVVRSGERRAIDAAELVPGDLVLLQAGDRVPADLRLTRVRDLQVDESALTGESVPVEKDTDVLPRDTILADRRNLCFSSALVTHGTGEGVVIATGDATQIGRISEMIATARVLETPLTRQIERFSRVLMVSILSVSALTFAVGLLRGLDWFDTFLAVVALAVGAIPEGLPAAVTIMLSIGVSRMARRRVIVRRLPAVETLGSTTVICSDKTGTLTLNRMTVQEVVAGGRGYRLEGSGEGATFSRDGEPVEELEAEESLLECLRAGVLCNDAVLREGEDPEAAEGDPTEAALLAAARRAGLRQAELASRLPRVDCISFESRRQYMGTLHDAGPGRPRVAYLKGSAEALLPRCTSAPDGASFDPDAIHALVTDLGARGQRVLAFARKELPPEHALLSHGDLESDLVFLGLQGMIDPPRPEAADAVEACQRAGIRVAMITGDHAATAGAVAGRLRIRSAPDAPPVLSGREIESARDEDLAEAVQRVNVFARVAPEHKLRLVQALQARGEVVAMTGDGVNDAPALRRADIGVAMGRGGTEVARESGDMVLTDDDFASIRAAVEEGRGIYDNLLKFLVWTLPTNGGEGLVVMLAVLLGATLPILPVQILWINMTTAGCLGLALAFEPKERGLMERPPRDPAASILDGALVQRIVFVSGLLCAGAFSVFAWSLERDGDILVARTAAVAVFVVGELFYLLNCRSIRGSMLSVGVFSNPWLWVGLASMAALQIVFTWVPAMNRLFHSRPLDGPTCALVLAVGLGIYALVGAEKWLRNRLSRWGAGGRAAPRARRSSAGATLTDSSAGGR